MTTMTRLLATVFALIALSLSLPALTAQDRVNDPTSFSWNPELSPSGPVLVAVSLESQRAAVFRNGIKIGESLVSTGFKGHETPTGVFHILNKDADHHSATYNNASMPYSERLTWEGVALHAGSLPGYPSSHGCIHLPYEFSKLVFGITHNGTTVVITAESPDVHVSDNHQVAFRPGEAAEFVWQPEASHDGPISLLFSEQDKRLFILRGGITIGECPAKTGFFKSKPSGTSAFLFRGWKPAPGDRPAEPLWVQVGGHSDNHAVAMDEWFEIDPRFQMLLEGMLTTGTNLVITDQPVSSDSSSDPNFSVMIGRKEEATAKDDQK